jgi:hypothetical protein
VALMWSLWAELGVPGTTRDHERAVVDPEALLVISPLVMKNDARLRDEVFRWCVAHADRVSSSRLHGLVRRARPEVRAAFGELAATLAEAANVRWPREPVDAPWPRVPERRPSTIQLMRPSLARLRLRAVAGVGARADVLAELLGRADSWTTASDLDYLGYSKRNVARVLSELAEAGVASQRADRNALVFQLLRAGLWIDVVHVGEVTWPRWDLILGLLVEALALCDLHTKAAAVRRVEATKARGRMSPLAEALGVPQPPIVRGNTDAWSELTQWAETQIRALPHGR